MKCFFCDKEIIGGYKLIALEHPYINLYFHPEHDILKDYDQLRLYLNKNLEKVYNMIDDKDNTRKNGRK